MRDDRFPAFWILIDFSVRLGQRLVDLIRGGKINQMIRTRTILNPKRVVLMAALSMLARAAFADGTVNFQNSLAAGIYLYDDTVLKSNLVTSATLGSQDTTGNGYASGGVLDAGLVWGTTAASVSTIYGGTLAGIEHIGSAAGRLDGTPNFSVAGTISGDNYYFQVFFWDSSFGDSLAGMQACVSSGGYFGAASAGAANHTYGVIGAPLNIMVGEPLPAVGTPIFGALGNVFARTVILDAPEPTSLLLGATGAIGLLLCGRRKSKALWSNG